MEILVLIFVIILWIGIWKENKERKNFERKEYFKNSQKNEQILRVKKYLSKNPSIEWDLLEIPINSSESQDQYKNRRGKLKKLLYSYSNGLLKDKIYDYIDNFIAYEQMKIKLKKITFKVREAEDRLIYMGQTRRIEAQLNPDTNNGKDFKLATSIISEGNETIPRFKSDLEELKSRLKTKKTNILKIKSDLMDSNYIL